MCIMCVQAGIAGATCAFFGWIWLKCKWCLGRAQCGKGCCCKCHKGK